MPSLSSTPHHERLIRKLESIFPISREEAAAVYGLPITIREFGAGEDLVRDGDHPTECCLILEGWACGYKLTASGARQILCFFIPGDIPDLQSLHLDVMDHGLGALTRCRAAFIPHAAVEALIRRHEGLNSAFWKTTLIYGAIFREWIVSLGRRPAYARIGHLLCELGVRLQAVGLGERTAYDLPLSQAQLSDALGLSPVHFNRSLQTLRKDGLVVLRDKRMQAPDWDGLTMAAEFDPAYLHLKNGGA